MEEDVTGQATAPALAVASPRPSRGAKPMVIVALLAFVIGVLLAGWLALVLSFCGRLATCCAAQ